MFEKKPTLVLLDNCFWDSKSYLTPELLHYKKSKKYHLVNVMQMKDAQYEPSNTKLEFADEVLAPSWKKNSLRWLETNCPIDKLRYYDETEMTEMVFGEQ